jgi:hypothetical protein
MLYDSYKVQLNKCQCIGKSAQDYLMAIGRREIAWIVSHAAQKPPGGLIAPSEAQRTPDAHIGICNKYGRR